MKQVWQPFREIRWIILHETGGPAYEQPDDLAVRLGTWPLYHWLVYPDGQIVKCASPSRLLYHVTDHNFGTLSVAVVGNYKSREPASALVSALEDLFRYIRETKLPGIENVIGHGEIDHSVDCPGSWWRSWLTVYRTQSSRGTAQRRDAMAVYPVTYSAAHVEG